MRKVKIVIGSSSLLLVIAVGWVYYHRIGNENQDSVSFDVTQAPHAARGFGTDSARVDSQLVFQIPKGQADAVYQYLKNKYIAKDDILKEQFPTIHFLPTLIKFHVI